MKEKINLTKGIIITIVLLIISPLFGIILADLVGYHEPLDVVSDQLNLSEWTEDFNWTPLLDYSIQGLPNELGYILSGLLGVVIILSLGFCLKRFLKKK